MKLSKLLLSFFCIGCTSSNTLNAQIPDKAEDISPLLIGETIPKVNLKDTAGNIVSLNEIIEHKPTVLIFYRGGWCPYCNLQLSGLVSIENEIRQLGYQIVAISPDDVKNLKPTIAMDSIKYKLYSDSDGNLIKKIGIAYKTPLVVKGYIAGKTKGNITEVLPVPTVLVIDTNGEILFEYIDPNYKKRISSEMLLAVLKSLN